MDTLVLPVSGAQDGAGLLLQRIPMSLLGVQKRRRTTTSRRREISLWTLMSERWRRGMAKELDLTIDQFIEQFKADLDKYKEFVEGESDYPSKGMAASEWFE